VKLQVQVLIAVMLQVLLNLPSRDVPVGASHDVDFVFLDLF